MTGIGAGSGSSADYINPQDVTNAAALGLESRNSAFGADAANREEGLLPSVYFDFDQSFVRPSDRDLLQDAADYLRANPEARLVVEGHCDWRGTTEYNLALGDRRASSVRDYLVDLGIADERIEVVSYGDREADTDVTDAQMQQDRRADLIVVR